MSQIGGGFKCDESDTVGKMLQWLFRIGFTLVMTHQSFQSSVPDC